MACVNRIPHVHLCLECLISEVPAQECQVIVQKFLTKLATLAEKDPIAEMKNWQS